MLPRDGNTLNTCRAYVQEIWKQVFGANYAVMTPMERAKIEQAFNNATLINPNDPNNLLTMLLNMQDARGGQLSNQEVYTTLNSWLAQARQMLRQQMPQTTMPMTTGFNTGMPMMGIPTQQPMMGMGANYYNPQPYNYNAQPYNPYGNMYGRPAAGMMPSQINTSLASSYGKPEVQQMPVVQPKVTNQTAVQNQVGAMPTMNAMPSTKISTALTPYKAPTLVENHPIQPNALYEVGEIRRYTNQDNESQKSVKVTLKPWVKTVHSALAEAIEEFKPTFLEMKFHTYQIIDIDFESVSKTFKEIKQVIQKAKAMDSVEPASVMESVLHTLDNKTNGVARLIQSIIINKFNQYIYTVRLDLNTYLVDSVDKIIRLSNDARDADITSKINMAINRILLRTLSETCVYDIKSKDVEKYIEDIEIGGTPIRNLKKTDEEFAAWATDKAILVSDEKTIFWTNLALSGSVTAIDEDDFTVETYMCSIGSEPADYDLEAYLQTAGYEDYPIATIIMNTNNVAVNYMILPYAKELYLRKASMF